MTSVALAHTADLDEETRRSARGLLHDVFTDMTDDDWDHALGGVHALVREGEDLVGHASVVQRRLVHQGRALRTGCVEGVAVRADRRGRGIGGSMMTALEGVIRRAYDVGVLGATDDAADFYAARGWRLWQGPTYAMTPSGVVRTPEDDDDVFVLPVVIPLTLHGDIICDWRDGDVW
jgi:aminoglycoside 2'-N-acetyltransferase I